VLERLTRGPAAVGALAQPFKMALPSFVQYLGVLEDCGLVRSNKRRVRTYALAPQPLKTAENWLSAQRLEWERRLDSLEDFRRPWRSRSQPKDTIPFTPLHRSRPLSGCRHSDTRAAG